MFKKLLKAALPALFVFSFANVNDAKVEAANKKINVRVDYLEEGSNYQETRTYLKQSLFLKT